MTMNGTKRANAFSPNYQPKQLGQAPYERNEVNEVTKELP